MICWAQMTIGSHQPSFTYIKQSERCGEANKGKDKLHGVLMW